MLFLVVHESLMPRRNLLCQVITHLFEISVDNYFYQEMCTSICSLFLVRFCQLGYNYWWTIPLRLLVAWKLYRCISCSETTNTFELTVYFLKF